MIQRVYFKSKVVGGGHMCSGADKCEQHPFSVRLFINKICFSKLPCCMQATLSGHDMTGGAELSGKEFLSQLFVTLLPRVATGTHFLGPIRCKKYAQRQSFPNPKEVTFVMGHQK